MLILILGVALFWGAHFFKRLAPGTRADMGKNGRGAVAAALIVSILLMTVGYRMTDGPYWWGASPALKGINNLLVLVAFYLFAADGMKTRITSRLRHPQLTGFSLWAVAHLLVNGDLPSFILFGGLLLWALAEMVVINRAQPVWSPPAGPFPMKKEVMAIAGAFITLLVVGYVHSLLGYNPFGG
ncbi:NnrU family protein [Paracoccus aestuariivivens]|uniref:NnrU domain-containing protein n=1 Tax=Paracoccus aestuariivivens TaxID=1820333 RepID=A0A6L6J5I8_9RHOB|nr:NnrU family protein [Paracoccus aestuariivivens]MTH76465.1 hypothetical protein [Paracoccus aestuariivivens]